MHGLCSSSCQPVKAVTEDVFDLAFLVDRFHRPARESYGSFPTPDFRWFGGIRVSYYNSLVEIHSSARKHGVADEDIEHAMDNAMRLTTETTTRACISDQLAMPSFLRSSRSFVTTGPSW